MQLTDAARRVDALVATHDAAQPPQATLQPQYRRPNTTRCVGASFFAHLQIALRAGAAVALVSVWHVVDPLTSSYLACAIAVLCSCGSIGGTLQRSVHSLCGAAATVPLALAAISAARATHPATGLAMLTLWSAVVGASTLPPAAHKTLLALSSADVTAALSAGGTGDMLPPLLEPLGAVGRGAACALAASLLLPRPRLARTSARAALRRAAAGVALLFDGALAQAERGAAAEQQWHLEADRLAAAVAHAVDVELPAMLDAARWELPCRRRAAAGWDEAQRACLRSLLTSACAADAALRDVRARDGGDPTLALAILRELRPALVDMSDCAKAFAARVAGGGPNTDQAANIASQCSGALDRFEATFGAARLRHIYRAETTATPPQISCITGCYAALFSATNLLVALHGLLSPSSTPRPPPQRCGAVGRALLLLGPRRHRALAGAQMGVAIGGAAALGLASGAPRAFWAPVTVAFVMGGASVRQSANRLQGTVLGLVVSYVGLVASAAFWPDGGMARDAALVGGLAVWVVLCAFVQHASATFGYSGFVAAFSAGILLFGTSCSIGAERCAGGGGGGGAGSLLEDVALERIEMTLLGIGVSVVVTTLTSNSSAAAHRALVDLLVQTSEYHRRVHAAWVVVSSGTAAAACVEPAAPADAASPAPAAAAATTTGTTERQGARLINGSRRGSAGGEAAASAATAAADDDGEAPETRRVRLARALSTLRALSREAADAPQCWRAPFPEAGVAAVAAALADVLATLGALHDASVALRPGGALVLLEPLLKPLARVELDVKTHFGAVVQKLRANGAAAWVPWAASAPTPSAAAPPLSQALLLLGASWTEVVSALIVCDRRHLQESSGGGAAAGPRLSHKDVLVFNAWIDSVRTLLARLQALGRRVDELLVLKEPLALDAISFV